MLDDFLLKNIFCDMVPFSAKWLRGYPFNFKATTHYAYLKKRDIAKIHICEKIPEYGAEENKTVETKLLLIVYFEKSSLQIKFVSEAAAHNESLIFSSH
jgi:hypothetical protein